MNAKERNYDTNRPTIFDLGICCSEVYQPDVTACAFVEVVKSVAAE